jgi:hypothetical protein
MIAPVASTATAVAPDSLAPRPGASVQSLIVFGQPATRCAHRVQAPQHHAPVERARDDHAAVRHERDGGAERRRDPLELARVDLAAGRGELAEQVRGQRVRREALGVAHGRGELLRTLAGILRRDVEGHREVRGGVGPEQLAAVPHVDLDDVGARRQLQLHGARLADLVRVRGEAVDLWRGVRRGAGRLAARLAPGALRIGDRSVGARGVGARGRRRVALRLRAGGGHWPWEARRSWIRWCPAPRR